MDIKINSQHDYITIKFGKVLNLTVSRSGEKISGIALVDVDKGALERFNKLRVNSKLNLGDFINSLTIQDYKSILGEKIFTKSYGNTFSKGDSVKFTHDLFKKKYGDGSFIVNDTKRNDVEIFVTDKKSNKVSNLYIPYTMLEEA